MLKSFAFPRSPLSSVLFCYLQHSTKKKKGKIVVKSDVAGSALHPLLFLSFKPTSPLQVS